MIIRIFHAKVRQGKENEFRKTLELISLPNIQARNGMVAIYPGQLSGGGSNDFVLITIWKDEAARTNLTREDWAKTIIPEDALPLLEEWHVKRYKSFGILEHPLKPIFQNI